MQGNFSVNRKDLRALTLTGPTMEILVLDPLDVQQLDNWLYMSFSIFQQKPLLTVKN